MHSVVLPYWQLYYYTIWNITTFTLSPILSPEWLQIIDKGVWDTLFFLFAGKAYATFSLLFGFSFYIQYHNAEKRGIDFRGRFAWRMVLLFLFAQLHALFYNGDILVLYSIVGFTLIPVCKLKNKTVFWIALILLLQPFEWGRMFYAMCNPDYVINGNKFMPYALLATEVTSHGTFLEVLNNNIWNGQLYSNHLAGRKRTPIPNCRIVHVRYVTGTYEVFRQEQCLHQNMETHIKTIRHCFHSTVYPAHIHTGTYQ